LHEEFWSHNVKSWHNLFCSDIRLSSELSGQEWDIIIGKSQARKSQEGKICAQSEFIADWNKQLKYERQHPSPTAARSQEWRTHACNVALYHEIKTRYGLAYTFLMEHSVSMYCAPTLWIPLCGGGVGRPARPHLAA
jgi:hypothetical protein